MPDDLLDAERIRQYVAEVAAELPDLARPLTIVLVGGAFMAWHDLRASTRDVDSASRLDTALVEAVERVAARHGLAPKWLNDAAAGFRPATLLDDECEVLVTSDRLRVLGAPYDQVFLMKLNASRAADTDDLVALWPLCSFGTPERAVDAFYEAYPHEERDPYLAQRIRAVVDV